MDLLSTLIMVCLFRRKCVNLCEITCIVASCMLVFLSAALQLVERHAAVDVGVLSLSVWVRSCLDGGCPPDSNFTPVPFGLGFLLLKVFLSTKFLFTFRVTHQKHTACTLEL